jgi:hypothetical protein
MQKRSKMRFEPNTIEPPNNDIAPSYVQCTDIETKKSYLTTHNAISVKNAVSILYLMHSRFSISNALQHSSSISILESHPF